MTKQTISITRALAELKRMDSRITTALSQGRFVSRPIGGKPVIAGETVESLTAKIVASFNQVESLIANRQQIKSKVILSNATTNVTVAGETMTVAEAIDRKTMIAQYQAYLTTLRTQFSTEALLIGKHNEQLETVIDSMLNQMFGSDRSKIDTAATEQVATSQRNTRGSTLLDPSSIQVKIDMIIDKISVMETEIDFTLSESNAKTVIELDL